MAMRCPRPRAGRTISRLFDDAGIVASSRQPPRTPRPRAAAMPERALLLCCCCLGACLALGSRSRSLCCMQFISPCLTLRSWTLCPPSSDPHQRLLVRLRRGIQRQLAIMVKSTTTIAHHQAAIASPPPPQRKQQAISHLMPQSLSSRRIDRGSSSSSSIR